MLQPEAQGIAKKVHYAPLPENVVGMAQEILNSVTYAGKSLK